MARLPGVFWLLPLCLLAGTLASAGDDVPKRADIERDLVLEAALTTPKAVEPGEPVRVTSRIVNRSKTRSYKLVKPGDGSESGWREPHVFFTAEAIALNGLRSPVPERVVGRCGMYDADWHDEVVTLEPGEALELTNWMPAAHMGLDFQQQGAVELRLHYRFTAGGGIGKGGKAPQGRVIKGPMDGVPAFELVSAPVRFTVVRHVDIWLKVKRDVAVGKPFRLSDVLRLHAKNLANDPISVSGAEMSLQILEHTGSAPLFSARKLIAPTVERKTPPLGGGATRTWDGRPAWDELPDWQLTATRAGTFQVVATWSRTGRHVRYASSPAVIRIR